MALARQRLEFLAGFCPDQFAKALDYQQQAHGYQPFTLQLLWVTTTFKTWKQPIFKSLDSWPEQGNFSQPIFVTETTKFLN